MSKFTMLFYLLGWAGLALILLFTINAAFSGTRLGLCWMMLEERYEEFRKEIRDPYPSIGEKAVGRLVKIISFVSDLMVRIDIRHGNLAGLKLKNGLFKHISGPRLGATLIMNKNGLLFLICSSMTLRRPQTSLDSIYFQEDMKNLKKE